MNTSSRVIVVEDRIRGTVEERDADHVGAHAWALVNGRMLPVARIVLTGYGDMRRIDSFGLDGSLLVTTRATRIGSAP